MIKLSRVKILDVVKSAATGWECYTLGPMYVSIDGKFVGWVVNEKGQMK